MSDSREIQKTFTGTTLSMENTEPDDIVQGARGRARFCRDRGEVKTPEFLEALAARIEALERERDAIGVHRDILIKSTADGIRELTEERDNLAAELEKVARLRVLAQRVCTLDATEPRDDLAVRVAIWDLRAAIASVQGEGEG